MSFCSSILWLNENDDDDNLVFNVWFETHMCVHHSFTHNYRSIAKPYGWTIWVREFRFSFLFHIRPKCLMRKFDHEKRKKRMWNDLKKETKYRNWKEKVSKSEPNTMLTENSRLNMFFLSFTLLSLSLSSPFYHFYVCVAMSVYSSLFFVTSTILPHYCAHCLCITANGQMKDVWKKERKTMGKNVWPKFLVQTSSASHIRRHRHKYDWNMRG